jgi:hypothetical protein
MRRFGGGRVTVAGFAGIAAGLSKNKILPKFYRSQKIKSLLRVNGKTCC